MKLWYTAAIAAALLSPLPAFAHHGWSGQDNAKLTTLEGKIEAVRYRNPHGEIDLSSGGQKWTVTLAPIQRMETRGVTADKLKVGQTVKVAGHRSLDQGKMELKANEIAIAGQTASLLR